MNLEPEKHNSSFRDPAGHIYLEHGVLYRKVNSEGLRDYHQLIESGLYHNLVECEMLISHIEVTDSLDDCKILMPTVVPVISYPYEWTIEHLIASAMLTLNIQETALEFDMQLKDATPFNVQFNSNSPIFIDTLSFTKNSKQTLWVAYRQFCELFLVPILIKKYVSKDIRLSELYFTDGKNLSVAKTILPFRARFNFRVFFHIYLHSFIQERSRDSSARKRSSKVTLESQILFIRSLKKLVLSIKTSSKKSLWSNYYQDIHYTDSEFAEKKEAVTLFMKRAQPKNVLDLAGNSGEFARLAVKLGANVVLCDSDELAVELAFVSSVQHLAERQFYLHLVADILNPTGNIGWAGQERSSLSDRFSPDLVLALAITHHLVITHAIPLVYIAKYLSTLSEFLVVEHCDSSDSQVRILNQNREIPDNLLSFEFFEDSFREFYSILEWKPLKSGSRRVYLLKRKEDNCDS